ncbi:MAG: DUF1294 domain-containing protein [Chloroflexi bacterium]|nr:MAG: DUF1294 domain-containing protein [Chloroflexota bacterium]
MGISIAHLIYGPAAAAAVAYATVQIHNTLGLAWTIAYLVAINVVAFLFYAFDKILVSALNFLHLRVPEDVLVWGLAFPGGIVGATLAMYMLQHKTGPGESGFRADLLKAYAVLITLVLITRRWPIVSQQQMDALVERLAGLVLSVVQVLLTTVRAS